MSRSNNWHQNQFLRAKFTQTFKHEDSQIREYSLLSGMRSLRIRVSHYSFERPFLFYLDEQNLNIMLFMYLVPYTQMQHAHDSYRCYFG